MNCRIIYKDNKIDHVQAENGERSILFDSLKDIFGAEKALELYALTEEDGYKQKIQEKVRSFVGVTEKQIDKLSEAIDAQETLNKLVETGLAENVYQMTSEELEAKLVELGVDANVAKQVSQSGGYYSNANTAFTNLKDKNIKNAQGWMKALTDVQKNGGIKNVNQELEWIGLEDYLNDYVKENNPKAGNIPSSVVEDYIKSNQIEIVDVNKGGDFKEVSYQDIDKAELIPNDKYGGYYVYYKNGFIDKVYGVDSIDEAIFQSIRESNFAESDSIQPTKYEAYQLKGGEVYREVLLTMPSKRTDITEAQKVLEEASLGNLSYDSQEVKDAQKTIDKYNSENKDEYSSSHWSEKNILAHVRLNEKTLPDGRRVLIVQEIQSDAAQEARKAGWQKKDAKTLKEADNHAIVTIPIEAYQGGIKDIILNDYPDTQEISLIEDKTGRVVMAVPVISGSRAVTLYENNGNVFGDKFQSADTVSFQDNNEFERYFLREFNRLNKRGVADFTPYKNTDQWVGLVTRRVMQMASQEGYDGIAFATGQQSADMYSLSQQVDKIDITPQGDIKAVYISMKNNADDTVFINQEGIITESASGAYNGKQAEEVLGKDLTRKILETEEETTLEGEGLEFGGEGMKTFYDKIVPKVVQKEAQRFDKNAKLETVDFSEKVLSYNEIQEMLQDFEKYPSGSRERADLRQQQETAPDTDKLSLGVQPYLPLTQSIKDSVSQGVPQFRKSGITPTTNGFIYKNDVYLNKNADDSVLLHEFNHLYNNWLKQNRPEVYKKGLDLVKAELGKNTVTSSISKSNNPSFDSMLDFNTEGGILEIGRIKGRDIYSVLHLKVDENFRRQGIASKLLKEALNKTNGNLSGQASNDAAVELNYKLGMRAYKNEKELSLEESKSERAKSGGESIRMILPESLRGENYKPFIASISEIQDIIDFVKTNQPNLEGEKLNEEILTELVGRRGLELLIEQKDKAKSSGIVDYLKQVWQEIKNMLGLSSYTDEQILNMNLQDFANASAVDLLRGERLKKDKAVKRNNGNPLNLAPNGKPSILYQSYKDLGYSDSEAEKLTAQVYSDSFLDFFGDWLTKSRYNVVTDFRFSTTNDYDFIDGFLGKDDDIFIEGEFYRVVEETEDSGIYKVGNLKGSVKYVDSFKGKNPSFFTGQLDKNGQPILMHHNTDNNFYEYDLNYKGKNNSSGGSVGKGIYLSKSKTGADKYGGSITKSFFVKANNPYSGVDTFSESSIDLAINLVNQEIDKSNHPDKNYAKEEAKDKIKESLEKGKIPYVSGYLTPLIITEILKNEGFDSIKDGSNDFVVFEPKQIKSATENIGAFSEESNDIRYQIIGEKGASKIKETLNLLDQAKQLENAGEDEKVIEQKTGWFKQNGDWKYFSKETLNSMFPTKAFINKAKIGQEYKLEEVLGSNKLFEYYPQLKDIKLKIYDGTKEQSVGLRNSEASYDRGLLLLNVFDNRGNGINPFDNAGQGKSKQSIINDRENFWANKILPLVHEIQHIIQETENFPMGGNPFTIERVARKLSNSPEGIPFSKFLQNVENTLKENKNLSKEDLGVLNAQKKSLEFFMKSGSRSDLPQQYKMLFGEFEARTIEYIKQKYAGNSEKLYTEIQDELALIESIKQEELIPVRKTSSNLKTEYNVTPQTSTNYANLTEDGEGNFVFYHVGDKGYDVIKRGTGQNIATSREEATAINRVGGVAMYYPAENVQESMFSGEAKYLIKVPQEKVYDFNRDALNLLDEAEQMFRKQFPNQAFDKNSKLAFVTKVANEKGFDAVVANWDSTTRVQTTKELKPLDEQITEGNKIVKDFSAENKFKSNKDKGWEVVPTVMQSKLLKDVYDKIETLVGNDFSNPLYRVREMAGYTFEDRFAPFKSQDEITDVVEKSNLPQEVKDEYTQAVTSQDKPGYSKLTKKPSLKIEVKEVNGRLVVEPLVNGTKAGALRMLPYEDGYRVDSVAVYDKYQNKRLGTRLYQEAIKFLLKSQTPLYSLKVRSENAKKIWDKFVAIGVAQKVGEDYIAPNKGGLDKNNEAKPSDVMQYANTTDEKLSKEETAEAINLAVSLGVESSQEVVAILKDAFLENNSFVFDKKKMKKAGYNDYEITKILTDVNLQNQIKNNLAKLENTDFSAPLMDVQTSPEIGIFGKQKVKPKVKTVNVKTVNEQGEVVDKVSDTKELLRKTYPDTLPNDMPQIASSLFKSSENVVNTHNDLFYNTLNDLKNAALDLGVDLKDIENRVFPLENFKSFVNSLMEYYANPSDTFAEVYDEFFENYEAEKATKPTMSTPYTEYELFDKFNLVRNGDEYVKVEDVEIEPSAERQAKIPQLEVEDFAVDFDKLEKLVYHKEQLGAEMKTLQKPLIEEINLREVKKNPYLKATSEGVKLVSEDPLTAQKAELYGYEPKVAEKQPKKIETDYSLVQDVLVTQLTSENKVRTPKGNFTKFMDDNNKSVFLLDGSKQSTVDLEGYLSKADNTPKIEAKKLYSKEEFENNFGCLN